MQRPTTLALAALCAGGIVLAACGGDDGDTQSGAQDGAGSGAQDDAHGGAHGGGDASAPADGARRVEVTGEDFAFDPVEITAEDGEDLAIELTSVDMLHDFNIDELDVHIDAGRGETGEGGLTVDEPGTYTYYCSVPGHRSAGMEGTLTVE